MSKGSGYSNNPTGSAGSNAQRTDNGGEILNNLKDNGWAIRLTDMGIETFNKLNLAKFDFDNYKNTINNYFEELGMEKPQFSLQLMNNMANIKFENEEVTCFRVVKFDSNGDLIAHQDYLDIDPKYQEKGIAPLIYRMNIEDYKRMGIQKVKMLANLDIGGYAWAKYGFSATKSDVENMIDRVFNKDKSNASKIVNEYYKTHDKKENFPMNLLSEFKDKLLGTTWSGQLDLKDKKQMKVFDEYLSGRERKYGLK